MVFLRIQHNIFIGMAGVYIHIPFCTKKCTYCDFYSRTDEFSAQELVSYLKTEMWRRRDFLHNRNIHTIYLGGGTPSLLPVREIEELLQAVRTVFAVSDHPEITLEANPDDLTFSYLSQSRNLGVNRLSIGIQSFDDPILAFLGRRHTAEQAHTALNDAIRAGFQNISIDLIYGIPGLTKHQWEKDLESVFESEIKHLSAYHLTYHPETPLWNDLKRGKIVQIQEEESIWQYEKLVGKAKENGFEQYEISNFARDGMYSKHNSAYWNQEEYLGLGPSAHSFNREKRYWNFSDYSAYKNGLSLGNEIGEEELLSEKDHYNEFIITRLRTKWGINPQEISRIFGPVFAHHIETIAGSYRKSGHIENEGESIRLTANGMFVSDTIISDFMM